MIGLDYPSLIMILAAALALSVAYYASRRRPAPGATSLAMLSLAVAVWASGYAAQLASTSPPVQDAFVQLQYLAVVVVPAAWLYFSLQYTRRDLWITPRLLVLLAIEPLVTLALVWTNHLHHLMWQTDRLAGTINKPNLLGPWFWANRVYSYSLLLIGIALLFEMFLRSPRLYRRQILALSFAALVPLAAELFSIFTIAPLRHINLTSASLSVSSLALAWGLVGYRLLDIIPAARDAVVESMRDGVIVLDPRDQVVDMNSAAERILDRPPAETIGQPAKRIFADWPELLERFTIPELAQDEIRVETQDGDRFLDMRISPLHDRSESLTGRVVVITDMSKRKQMENALRESEERYALAVRGVNDGLWDWDLRRDRLFLSSRWKEMLGHSGDEIGSSPSEWFTRIHPEDTDRVQRRLQAHLDGHASSFASEHRLLHRDGTFRWFLARGAAVHDAEGFPIRMAGSFTDITDRKRAEEELLYAASHDLLTGLGNRSMFLSRLQLALARAERRKDYHFGVLYVDLDRFKLINDSLGHIAGDEVLISVGQRLRESLRSVDTVARLGGDEFVILLEDLRSSSDAGLLADRVLNLLSRAHLVGDQEVYAPPSIGIVASGERYTSGEELMRDADAALYRAKERGGSCSVVFNAEMHARALQLLHLETDLRRALDRSEFELFYQPILHLRQRRPAGFEALIRWRHPKRGLLLPEHFLALAEETGLIIPLGHWILHEACRQTAEWIQRFPELAPLTISVNLSSRQLRDQDLVDQVIRALEDSKLSPSNLILEISEGAFLGGMDGATHRLSQLADLGIGLHIDDFGTGYSSLSSLHQFPVDAIKIDRSFIHRLVTDPRAHEIVQTIVRLGGSLTSQVIAEGVESGEVAEELVAINCEWGQGFYLAEPVGPDSVLDMLEGGIAPLMHTSRS